MDSSIDLTFDQFPFLKNLGLEKDNLGSFNGKDWFGNGESVVSINPATGKVNKYLLNI
jgi:hypothetical protein